MTYMTSPQQIAAVDYLAARGWTYAIDRHDPRGEYRGWWLHPQLRPRPTGDSAKMYYAAEIAFGLAGYDTNELAPSWAQVYA